MPFKTGDVSFDVAQNWLKDEKATKKPRKSRVRSIFHLFSYLNIIKPIYGCV